MSEDENVYIEDNDIQNYDLNGENESAGSEKTGSTFGDSNDYSQLNSSAPKQNMFGKKNQASNFAKNLTDLAKKSGKGDKIPEALKNRKHPTPSTNVKSGDKEKDKETSTQKNEGQKGLELGQSGAQTQEKNVIEKGAEKVVEKGGSAILQRYGIPKGVADKIAGKLAGPAVQIAKHQTKFAIITTIASAFLTLIIIVVSISIIIMPILKGLEVINEIQSGVTAFFSSARHWISGDGWCATDAECVVLAEDKFYDKVKDVSEDYPTVDMPLVLSSVLYGINTIDNFNDVHELTPDEETQLEADSAGLTDDEKTKLYQDAKSRIKKVAKKLSKGKDEYDEYMLETYIPTYYKEYMNNGTTAQQILDEIYLLAQLFKDFKNMTGSSTTGRICTYTVDGKDLKNIKIRLLACNGADVGYGEVLPDEDLVDLEKYVLGGTAQEIGADSPEEAIKAQAIAIRSYVLRRSEEMGGAYNLDIDYQNNIVNIRACTDDLAYCDPDKGCWSNGLGGEGQQTIHTGVDKSKHWSKDPIPEDAKIREIVASTAGMVGLQSTGEIAYTPFMQPEQTRWIGWANSGMDYIEILKKEYAGSNGGDVISTVKANCTSGLSGEWDTWRQFDTRWASTPLGGNTLGRVGCLMTSIAIQIARSGTQINLPAGVEFNPGTFIQYGGMQFGSGGGYLGGDQWTQELAPGFVRAQDGIDVCGTRQEKVNGVAEYINQGYYPVMRVKYEPYGEHWVAVTGTNGNEILMVDPASESTEVFAKYGGLGVNSNCLRINTFKRTD